MNKSGLAIAVALASSVWANSTLAEETVERSSGFNAIVEEVVVTARRREEGLQDAPIAISAYTGDSLDYRGITTLDEISRFAPSLTLENNPSFGGASNSAAIYLRGVAKKNFCQQQNPAWVYMLMGSTLLALWAQFRPGRYRALGSIARAQGTLFGRNTIGGAISITTLKPK